MDNHPRIVASSIRHFASHIHRIPPSSCETYSRDLIVQWTKLTDAKEKIIWVNVDVLRSNGIGIVGSEHAKTSTSYR